MKAITTLLVLCVLGLLGFGLVMLFSVSPWDHSTKFVSRQAIAAGIGLAGGVALAWVDYRRLRSFAWPLALLAVLMLILVLIPPLGHKANGARRWFRTGGFQFQPSDFAKLAVLIGLAHYGAYAQRFMHSFRRGILVPILSVGLVLGLLFLEPDWGTAILIASVTGVVLLVAGARWYYLLPPAVFGAAFVGVLLIYNPVRSDRIYSWLHLEETKSGLGFQVWQSRLALGSGGVGGVGLNHSTQKKLVPEFWTDFIFAIVGEEFGFIGSAAVLLTFTILFLCGLTVAWRAADAFGRLLATGITFLIGVQALINIGVVSGALPNKGLALPFLSYGGSNLIIVLFCAGILVSIARQAEVAAETESSLATLPGMAVTQLA